MGSLVLVLLGKRGEEGCLGEAGFISIGPERGLCRLWRIRGGTGADGGASGFSVGQGPRGDSQRDMGVRQLITRLDSTVAGLRVL